MHFEAARRVGAAFVVAVVLALGCANVIGLKEGTEQGKCEVDEDCAPAHGCIQGSCRSGCGSDQDCDVGSRCLKVVDRYGCLPLAQGCGAGCPTGADCVGGACRTTCSEDGECAGGQVCQSLGDDVPGACVGTDRDHDEPLDTTPSGCEAGLEKCEGPGVVRCDSKGRAFELVATCGADELCVDAKCTKFRCVPGTDFCAGDEARRCDEDGLSSALITVCEAGSFCAAATATCEKGLCAASRPACDGNVATMCDASGSAFEPGGTECGQRETCSDGTCKPWICEPGQSFCESARSYECSRNGLGTTQTDSCTKGEFCEQAAGTAACVPQVCEPRGEVCDGNRAKHCNDEGSGYALEVNCSDYDETCSDGNCSGDCQPEERRCGPGNKLQSCDTSGQWTKGTDCAIDETCVDDACGGVCGPSQSRCTTDNKVQGCDATGSYSGGTACPASKTCLLSQGVAECGGECGPGQTSCDSTVPQTCDANGAWVPGAIVKGTCGAACTPGGPTQCSSTLLQTCKADGTWNSGAVVVGMCNAECSPDALRCSTEIGQACNTSGKWVSNGSSAPCTCWVADRFKRAGKNLSLDTKTGLTWEAALRPTADWNVASATCGDLGMRLPTLGEWDKVMIPTEKAATCGVGAHPPWDSAGMPTTLAEIGMAQSSSGTVFLWTKDPIPAFPGSVWVWRGDFAIPAGSSNGSWHSDSWDDVTSKSHPYRCVK